jgi:membrane protein
VPAPAPTSPTARRGLAEQAARLRRIYQREIWQVSLLRDRSFKGQCFAVLRVVSITVTVFMESRIASRAAALSFSSLLGLGPIVAITVLVAGFALGQNSSPEVISDTLNRILKIVAPQIAQYEAVTMTSAEVNPQLVEVINNIIVASRSGSAGTFGIFTLLLIVLLLFKSIEDTFNDIWGVRQGRSLITRIVFYWTILTLGALLFFTSVALLGAGTFVNVFMEKLPIGSEWLKSLGLALPFFSFMMLTAMLTLVYRVVPNTRVFWRAAAMGGLVVATLLVANNYVAFVYMKRVVLEKSLYGGLALPLVVMSGLYIFWLCVLTGGIVSYAIQNVHFRNSQAAWSTLAESMRERLSLVVFLTICRRFRDCLPPISASHLSTMLKVPAQLLNECLNRLEQVHLVTPLQPAPDSSTADPLYQPARPLNRITLHDFKTLDDNLGEDPVGSTLGSIDPLVGHYDAALAQLGEQAFFKKTLDELFDEYPFEESRPPFALGASRKTK